MHTRDSCDLIKFRNVTFITEISNLKFKYIILRNTRSTRSMIIKYA